MNRFRKRYRVHLFRYPGRTCVVGGLAFGVVGTIWQSLDGWPSQLPDLLIGPALHVGSWIACYFTLRFSRKSTITAARMRETSRQLEDVHRQTAEAFEDAKTALGIQHLPDDEALEYIEEVDRRYKE